MNLKAGSVRISIAAILIIFLITASSGLLFYQQYKSESLTRYVEQTQTSFNPESQLATQQHQTKSANKWIEPEVKSWKPFINEQFDFQVDVPSNWYQLAHTTTNGFFSGSTTIMFSPTPFPSEDRLDLAKPYIHILIYPTTQPNLYPSFQKELAGIGRIPAYKEGILGGEHGVDTEEGLAALHNGNIYELQLSQSLSDSDTRDHHDSALFLHMSSSFRFLK